MIDAAGLHLILFGLFLFIPTILLSRTVTFGSNPYWYSGLVGASFIGILIAIIGLLKMVL